MTDSKNSYEQEALRIWSLAERTFGCADKARRWLNKPKIRFGGRSPADMLVSEDGIRQVEVMLIQIQEGYSF